MGRPEDLDRQVPRGQEKGRWLREGPRHGGGGEAETPLWERLLAAECWRHVQGWVPTDSPSENGVAAPWVGQSPYRTRVCVHSSPSRRGRQPEHSCPRLGTARCPSARAHLTKGSFQAGAWAVRRRNRTATNQRAEPGSEGHTCLARGAAAELCLGVVVLVVDVRVGWSAWDTRQTAQLCGVS